MESGGANGGGHCPYSFAGVEVSVPLVLVRNHFTPPKFWISIVGDTVCKSDKNGNTLVTFCTRNPTHFLETKIGRKSGRILRGHRTACPHRHLDAPPHCPTQRFELNKTNIELRHTFWNSYIQMWTCDVECEFRYGFGTVNMSYNVYLRFSLLAHQSSGQSIKRTTFTPTSIWLIHV